MSSLFNSKANESYTEEALAFETQVQQAVQPIMEHWMSLGYSKRELFYIALDAIKDIELTAIILERK